MTVLSTKIRKYRKDKNITQEQLAKVLYVTKQAVSKWETGKCFPDIATLPKLSSLLRISLDELLLNRKTAKKEMFINKMIYSILLIFVGITLSFSIYHLNQIHENTIEIIELEEKINFQLNHRGKITSIDFTDWSSISNELEMDSMSYIIYDDNKQTSDLVESIKSSPFWTSNIDNDILAQIPSSVMTFAFPSDYFMIYNITLNEYNKTPDFNGQYTYILLCYQKEVRRLLVFTFTNEYIGGII